MEIFFIFFVPFCTLSSMVFSLAFRIATGFLPVFLPDIREEPLAANATGTFSRGRFRHCIFSAGRVIQMKIQFFSKALKGNLKNEVLKAAFAAGSAGYFFQRTRAG